MWDRLGGRDERVGGIQRGWRALRGGFQGGGGGMGDEEGGMRDVVTMRAGKLGDWGLVDRLHGRKVGRLPGFFDVDMELAADERAVDLFCGK